MRAPRAAAEVKAAFGPRDLRPPPLAAPRSAAPDAAALSPTLPYPTLRLAPYPTPDAAARAPQVDLDINGTANSVRLDEVELTQAAWPWSVPAAGAPANESAATPMKSLRRSTPETEDGAAVPYAAGGTTAFAVVNERALNRWGDARGYRIQARAATPAAGAAPLRGTRRAWRPRARRSPRPGRRGRAPASGSATPATRAPFV